MNLVSENRSNHNLSLILHVSTESGRLDPYSMLQNDLLRGGTISGQSNKAWLYASGLDELLGVNEKACVKVQQRLKKGDNATSWNVHDLSWYMARWMV